MKALHDIKAPAKLNMFLHVLGLRPDGYHLIQSVFVLIDWCDTLHFETNASGLISREDLNTPLPKDDLILQAARALQETMACKQGVHIAVDKAIPAQAGLGGGSSDAASTLLALNRLWNLKLSLDQLCTLGLSLGADVPFFLRGHHAWVEGIGEQITPIDIPPSQFLVVKPAQGLDTRSIFSHPDLKRDTPADTICSFLKTQSGQPPENYFLYGRNDLQAMAEGICPDISLALNWLADLGLSARMTGSGSAVFAYVPTSFEWPAVPDGMQARLCLSLEDHPFERWASSVKVDGGFLDAPI
jgi:4-diphosphocytidyl-2-C-methyl-D-erythritol kinase